jgi:hypothetical protein
VLLLDGECRQQSAVSSCAFSSTSGNECFERDHFRSIGSLCLSHLLQPSDRQAVDVSASNKRVLIYESRNVFRGKAITESPPNEL